MLNSAPARWTVVEIVAAIKEGPRVKNPFGFEPARVHGYYDLGSRLRLAWDVFRGEADALYWPWQSSPRALAHTEA